LSLVSRDNKLEVNFIIYLLGKIVSAGAALGSIPIFINIFGEESYGSFVFLYATFLMLMSGSSGWIVQGVLRFYSLEIKEFRIKEDSLQMATNSAFIFSLILAFVFLFFNTGLTVAIIAAISIFLSVFYTVHLAIEQSKINSLRVVLAEIVRASFFLFTPLILKKVFPELKPLVCLFSGIFLSYGAGLLYLSKTKISIPLPRFTKTKWNTIFLKYGFPLSLWLILSPTTNGVDRYIIQLSLGSITLAKFAAVFDIIFKLFSNLLTPLNNIVQPMLINSYNSKDIEQYKKTMLKSSIYISIAFLCFFAGILLLEDFILCGYLDFCEEKEQLSKLFIPLLCSAYIWQLSILFQKNIEVSNRTLELTSYIVVVSSIQIFLGLYLVPLYGIISSAYLALVVACTYLFLVIRGTFKHFKI